MRYIDIAAFRPANTWSINARRLGALLSKLSCRARKKKLSKVRLWGKIKKELLIYGNHKCWYSECKSQGFHYSVDHFRPKNAVRESPSHPGYWWLACDYTNYRISCQWCNSDKKGSHFPLIDEKKRCQSVSDPITRESPVLLDPTNPADVKLLTFKIDGSATSSCEDSDGRVETSIKMLWLNNIGFVEARKSLFKEISMDIELAERYPKEQRFKDAILRHLRPDAEYSAAAIACVKTYRDKEFINRMLVSIDLVE